MVNAWSFASREAKPGGRADLREKPLSPLISILAVMPIRAATPADAEAIAQVHVESWRHAYRDILSTKFLAGLSVEKRQAMWSDSIAKGLPHILVAELNGQVVGFSAIGPCRDEGSPPTSFEIWAIYLSQRCWSKGHGRELWLASREIAVVRGACSISLWVIANNERAIKFYRSAGFMPEANSLKPLGFGGGQINEVRYIHRLDG